MYWTVPRNTLSNSPLFSTAKLILPVYCFFEPINRFSLLLRFVQCNPVWDHHHAERLGTKYKDQSTTEIETSSHGSEVCNCHVQRVFFFSLGRISGFTAHNRSLATKEKNPLAPRVEWKEIFNNYSSSPNGLWVNSPWGWRPNGLLTQSPFGLEE